MKISSLIKVCIICLGFLFSFKPLHAQFIDGPPYVCVGSTYTYSIIIAPEEYTNPIWTITFPSGISYFLYGNSLNLTITSDMIGANINLEVTSISTPSYHPTSNSIILEYTLPYNITESATVCEKAYLKGLSYFSPSSWEIAMDVNGSFNTLEEIIGSILDWEFDPKLEGYDYDTTYYFRLANNPCGTELVSNTTTAITVRRPPPTISSITPNAPTCPSGDNGSIIVKHGSIEAGVSYTYSITKYIETTDPPFELPDNLLSLDTTGMGIPFGYQPIAWANAENTNGLNTFTINNGSLKGGGGEFNFGAGIYIVKVESSEGSGNVSCFTQDAVTIDPPVDNFNIVSATPSSTSCVGASDGQVIVKMTKRNTKVLDDISYTLSKPDGSQVIASVVSGINGFKIMGLDNGVHTLTVKDQCALGPHVSKTFTIEDGTTLTVTPIQESALTCLDTNSGNGKIAASVNIDNSITYSYQLYSSDPLSGSPDPLETFFANSMGGGFAEGINANTYWVKATSTGSAAGCSGIESIALSKPSTLSYSATGTNSACPETSPPSHPPNGVIDIKDLIKASGIIDFKCILKNSGGTLVEIKNRTNLADFSFTGLAKDTYTISFEDNCNWGSVPAPQEVIIGAPGTLAFNTNFQYVQVGQTYKIACASGTQLIKVGYTDGGGSSYSYAITKGGTTVASGINSGGSHSLGLGSYDLSVSDGCGNTISFGNNFTIGVYNNVEAITTIIEKYVYPSSNDNNVTCDERSDGKLTVKVKGGKRGTIGNEYIVEMLNGLVVEAGALVNKLGNDGEYIIFEITNLAHSITNYQVRVTDYNTEQCSNIYNTDANGQTLELTAPNSLSINPPNLTADFNNLILINNQLYAQCLGDTNGEFTAHIAGGNLNYSLNLYQTISGVETLKETQTEISSSTATFTNLGYGAYHLTLDDTPVAPYVTGCTQSEIIFTIDEADTAFQINSVSAKVYSHNANTKCYGSNDGEITIGVEGGVGTTKFGNKGAYIYTLINDNETPLNTTVKKISSLHTFINLPAIHDVTGDMLTYTLTVSDTLGCVASFATGVPQIIKLSPPDTLEFAWEVASYMESGYDIPCKGGEATVSITSEGGAYPHVVTLNGISTELFASEETFFYLSAGTYTATILDAEQCTTDLLITLIEPDTPVAISPELIIPPVCIGGSDGEITVSATGGVLFTTPSEPYKFIIKNSGSLNYDIDTLRGSTVSFTRPANFYVSQDYDVMVIDKHGCTSEVTITMPPNSNPLTLIKSQVTPPSCYGGNDGSITLTASNYDLIGGTSLIFKLSGGNLDNMVIDTLVAGNVMTFKKLEGTDLNGNVAYQAWVTDNNSCQDSAYNFLANIQVLSSKPINLTFIESVRPACFNGADGSLTVKVGGGTGSFEYSQDNSIFKNVRATDSLVYLTGLQAGKHTLYFRDASYVFGQSACLITESFDVPEGRFIDVETHISHVSCVESDDGAIDLTPIIKNMESGELQEPNRLTFDWAKTSSSTATISTGEDLINLTSGNYTVKVGYNVDSLICRTGKSINVLQPQDGAFRFENVVTYNTSCGNYNDGRVVISTAGGWADSLGYYAINKGGWNLINSSPFIISGLASGIHEVDIAQAGFNCVNNFPLTIEADKLALELTKVVQPSCPLIADGVIVVSLEDLNVEYAINGGAFQASGIFTDLAEGEYELITQRVGDVACNSESLIVNVNDPIDCGNGSLIAIMAATLPSTCQAVLDGSAQVLAQGGVPPYTYYWNGNLNAGTDQKTGLLTGDHYVRVVDAVSTEHTVNFTIAPLSPLEVNPITSLASCNGICDGTVSLLITGGSENYDILWNDGNTDAYRENLCPDIYQVTVSDQRNGQCVIQQEVLIEQFSNITYSVATAESPTCPNGVDGRIILELQGGSGDQTVVWENGNVGTMLENYLPGTYGFTIKDNILGCQITGTASLPDALPITITDTEITQPSCNGGSDGKVKLIMENVLAPLVQWDNGQIGTTATGLNAGTHGYTVTGSKGCNISASVEITDRDMLVVNPVVVIPNCFGECNGQITLNITGGEAPYYVKWAHGSQLKAIDNLCNGTYNYTVTDKFNCQIAGSVEVFSPEEILVEANLVAPLCFGGQDGSISLNVSGGAGSYTYEWSNGSVERDIAGLAAGTYDVVVWDANGCFNIAEYTLDEPMSLLLLNDVVINPACSGSSDGEIFPDVTGGTAPYKYLWDDQSTDPMRNELVEGTYILNIKDDHGCENSKSYNLAPPLPLEIVNEVIVDPACYGDGNGAIAANIIGGVAPYSASWSNGDDGMTLDALTADTYTLSITDANNCLLKKDIVLMDPERPIISGISDYTEICEGSTIAVAPDGIWSAYDWAGPDGYTASTQRVEVGVAGEYVLTTWDNRGCPAKYSFLIEESNDLLNADFLILSEAIAFEPVVFVDISNPIPESLEWVIAEEDNIVINYKSTGNIEMVFTSAGEYDIGMVATMSTCRAEIHKIIVVDDPDAGGNSGGRMGSTDESNLDITVYPNPASQEVSLQVAATSREPVQVWLISNVKNAEVMHQVIDGQFDYLIRWDVSQVNSGLYYLVYEQEGERFSKRIMIIR